MIIELLNGTRYDIADYSLKRLFHYIPSAVIEHTSSPVEGRSNVITNTKINNRVITVELLFIANDIFDFYLLRDEVNALFLREESFYLIFKNEPYKRWKVKTNAQYTLTPHRQMESFTVDFITQSEYAESTATTKSAKEWDIDVWAWNGAIDWDTPFAYTFTTSPFTVNNVGTGIIDPRKNELTITIKATAASYLQITNTTTGDVYRYNGALTANDTLVLKGIQSLKNNVSVFKDTDKQLITLAVGQNSFTVEGGTIQSIDFDFRFLYK